MGELADKIKASLVKIDPLLDESITFTSEFNLEHGEIDI